MGQPPQLQSSNMIPFTHWVYDMIHISEPNAFCMCCAVVVPLPLLVVTVLLQQPAIDGFVRSLLPSVVCNGKIRWARCANKRQKLSAKCISLQSTYVEIAQYVCTRAVDLPLYDVFLSCVAVKPTKQPQAKPNQKKMWNATGINSLFTFQSCC